MRLGGGGGRTKTRSVGKKGVGPEHGTVNGVIQLVRGWRGTRKRQSKKKEGGGWNKDAGVIWIFPRWGLWLTWKQILDKKRSEVLGKGGGGERWGLGVSQAGGRTAQQKQGVPRVYIGKKTNHPRKKKKQKNHSSPTVRPNAQKVKPSWQNHKPSTQSGRWVSTKKKEIGAEKTHTNLHAPHTPN